MHSFFVNKRIENTFLIEGKDLHHLKNVIKLKEKEKIYCIYLNEKYKCEIQKIENNNCVAVIKQKINSINNDIKINLFIGLIREQKFNLVLQKATELGVFQIIPVEFKRNVVIIDPKKIETKIKRWQAICEEGAKQAKRLSIPKVENIVKDLNDLSKYDADIKLVAWENDNNSNLLKKYLQTNFKIINIVIGPEGGLEQEEIKLLNEMNYKTVKFWNNILRSETASIFLISAIQYEKS